MSLGSAYVQYATGTYGYIAAAVDLDASTVVKFNPSGSSLALYSTQPVIDSTNTYAYVGGLFGLTFSTTWQIDIASNSVVNSFSSLVSIASCISNNDAFLYTYDGFSNSLLAIGLPAFTTGVNYASSLTQTSTSATADPVRPAVYLGFSDVSANPVISKFDTSSHTFTTIYTASAAGSIVVGSVTPFGDYLFFTESLGGPSAIVKALDLTTNTVAWSVTCSSNTTTRPLCNSNGSHLYVGNVNAITDIDIAGQSIAYTQTTGTPISIGVTQDNAKIAYVQNSIFRNLFEWDVTTHAFGSVALGHQPGLLATTRPVALQGLGASTTTYTATAVATVTSRLTNSIVMIV